MKPQPSLKKSPTKAPAERVVKDIRRQTRRHFSAEDKIRIVLARIIHESGMIVPFGVGQGLPVRRPAVQTFGCFG